jgi:hypothetical protein
VLKAMALRANVHEFSAIAASAGNERKTSSGTIRSYSCALTGTPAERRDPGRTLEPGGDRGDRGGGFAAVGLAGEALRQRDPVLPKPAHRPPLPVRCGKPQLRRGYQGLYRLCPSLWRRPASMTCARAPWPRPGRSLPLRCARSGRKTGLLGEVSLLPLENHASGALPRPIWSAVPGRVVPLFLRGRPWPGQTFGKKRKGHSCLRFESDRKKDAPVRCRGQGGARENP